MSAMTPTAVANDFKVADLSLAEFLEDMVRHAFAGRQPLSDAALAQGAELMRIYGLDPQAIAATPAQPAGRCW